MDIFIFDEGRLDDYDTHINATSRADLIGWSATAWNTDLSMTGWWQGMNVFAMTTNSPLYNPDGNRLDAKSQAIQMQQAWETWEEMPWLWTDKGQDYTLTMSMEQKMPVSWGNNLQQGLMFTRFEDVTSGQKLWVQFHTFNNRNGEFLDIYRDPHTGNQDIVINLSISEGNAHLFDFSASDTIKQHAYDEFNHYEVGMSRGQFTHLIGMAENALGIDLQNESGYWSMIQAGWSPEMASNIPELGIGEQGAMQMAMENLSLIGG